MYRAGATIAKAMRGDRAFIRKRNSWALARWRGKHRAKYNAYQAVYQRKYRTRKREQRSGVL
jgi:hypothetical protein